MEFKNLRIRELPSVKGHLLGGNTGTCGSLAAKKKRHVNISLDNTKRIPCYVTRIEWHFVSA